MTDKEKITLQVTAEQKANFRDVARALGYVVDYGTEKGKGNMSALVRAIADGELICVPAAAVEAAAKRSKAAS